MATIRRPVMLITGASRGIGAATALMAADHGFDIAVGFHSDQRAAESVADGCVARGARAEVVRVDLAEESSIVSCFEAAERSLGRIDSFVNNAGVVDRAAPLAEMSAERIQSMFEVNAVGPIIAAREAVRHMSTERGGHGGTIINVSSIASRLGSPNEYIDYAATKGALDSMTVGLAHEVAQQGIRVNAVRPGLIYTEIHEASGIVDRVDKLSVNVPLRRGGEPAEVASAIVWLASDAASFVTGTFIDVSGGR